MSLANLLEEKFSTDMLIKFARIRGIARYGFFQQFKKIQSIHLLMVYRREAKGERRRNAAKLLFSPITYKL